MSKRLEILKNSLSKKNEVFDNKLNNHFETVAQANGQPLNDKKNGVATFKKWDKQKDSIRNTEKEIKKTEAAIEREEFKISRVEYVNETNPKEILQLVEDGVLTQWRKHPNRFFVAGVDKARIVWDSKKNQVLHQYLNQIIYQEQRTKFTQIYNDLREILNK